LITKGARVIKRRLLSKIGIGALCTLLVAGAFQSPAEAAPILVTADRETVPVTSSGDSADDPAIWVNPTDPSQSIVIGNDKGTALEVYDLSGTRIQLISGGHGNVDVRTGLPLGSSTVDIAAAAAGGIRVYRINPATRQLTNITEGGRIGSVSGEGFCLYRSSLSGLFYAFIITISGFVQQVRLGDANNNGLVDGQVVRTFSVGSESEGCVADDERRLLYVSQEDVAVWRYGAEPGDSPAGRVRVDSVGSGGNLAADVEGLTIVHQSNGTGYLLASAQNVADPNNSFFTVYERQGANAFLKSFRVVAGPITDDCSRTDGIAAVAANLGPSFPSGLFVCQDNGNTTPGSSGNQNFKFVRLEKILTLNGSPPPGDTTPPDTTIVTGPPASTNSTSATFTFTANEAGSTFLCKRDANAEAPCTSGISYSGLTVGSHHFEVRAKDPAGNIDPTPATWNWTITSSPPPPSGIITTVAGTGALSGFSGDGGPATSARLRGPRTMEADANGNLYIVDTDNQRVRKVDSTGKITTLAGTGTAGYSGDGGPATSARLQNPHGVAVDSAGNVYIADSPNQRIRKVSPNGIITTVAGTGSSGYNGDNIRATAARLNYPKGVEVGPDGALYIGDANNHRVRRVDLSTGVITTAAGTGSAGSTGDGGPATSARLNKPRNVTFGPDGDLYIADDENFKVRRVDAVTKTITTVAGTGTPGYSGDGGAATSARLNLVRDVAVDSAGNLYIADEVNHRIRWVDPSGTIRTFAGTGVSGFSGDGGLATSARIRGPRGVAVDPQGRVLIGDTGNHAIRRVS
jgi:myo-inositol-hexaphosphate 3-phosphohydrolase/sugar lactone lactonase YvrE